MLPPSPKEPLMKRFLVCPVLALVLLAGICGAGDSATAPAAPAPVAPAMSAPASAPTPTAAPAPEKMAPVAPVVPALVPASPVYTTVTIENAAARVRISTDRGSIECIELLHSHPITLPEHLKNPDSQEPKVDGKAVPLQVVFPINVPNDRYLHSRLNHSGTESDAKFNGLVRADRQPWTVAKADRTEATLTFAKADPALAYSLTYRMHATRPTVEATLTIRSTAAAEAKPVVITPSLVPFTGLHQDYGPGESYYLGVVAGKGGDQGSLSTNESFPGNGAQVDIPNLASTDFVGLKSRFFAAWFTPRHLGTAAAVPVTATPNAVPVTSGGPEVGSMPSAAPVPVANAGPIGTWTRATAAAYDSKYKERQCFLQVFGEERTLKPGDTLIMPWSLSVAEMTSKGLAAFTPLEQKIEYTDWMHRFFRILSDFITLLLGWIAAVVVNYGVAVVVLTFLIKLAMHRLTFKQYESMMKMQKLAPDMKYIQEQYKNDKQKAAMKQMELFKKHQVNPLGGCLPVLIQIPIFIALYQTFAHSADMRGQGFLWVKDLTLPDQLVFLGFHFPSWVPLYADLPGSINPLPLIYIAVTIWMSFNQKPPTGGDPMQEQMAKTMRWMPVLFGLFFYNMPAGLTLYFTVQAVLSTIEIKMVKKKLGMP